MQRSAAIGCFVAIVSGCGVEDTDDRPRTLEYITKAIFQPSCGTTQCHSTFRQAEGYVFDTVAATRQTFQQDISLLSDPGELTPRNPPRLIVVLTKSYDNAPRMPYDAPLPNADILLIDDWIRRGGPGVCQGATSCHGPDLIACTDDGAYDFTQVVPGGCR